MECGILKAVPFAALDVIGIRETKTGDSNIPLQACKQISTVMLKLVPWPAGSPSKLEVNKSG